MRILIILALFLVLYYMLRGLFQPRRREETVRRTHPDVGPGRDNELVQDPYCQTYVPIDTAFRAKMAGKDLFFCSKECMTRYVQERKKSSLEAG